LGEEKDYVVTKIPIMVRSKYCSLNLDKQFKNKECDYDPGCYFIVRGSERVVLCLERICENKILIFKKKDPTYKNGITYILNIYSKQHEINANI
jgi:DNA-directed RNA polymerase beta subunit